MLYLSMFRCFGVNICVSHWISLLLSFRHPNMILAQFSSNHILVTPYSATSHVNYKFSHHILVFPSSSSSDFHRHSSTVEHPYLIPFAPLDLPCWGPILDYRNINTSSCARHELRLPVDDSGMVDHSVVWRRGWGFMGDWGSNPHGDIICGEERSCDCVALSSLMRGLLLKGRNLLNPIHQVPLFVHFHDRQGLPAIMRVIVNEDE